MLSCLLLAACSGASPSPQRAATTSTTSAATETLVSPDVVGLTVYFRRGAGEGAHLVPITREVSVTDHLPRRALELLLAGPDPDDGSGMAAPLPTSTAVLDFAVDGEVAQIDLSAEVIADRASVGASAAHELLGLAALANTLTEFPEIDEVEVTVEGRRSGTVDGLPTTDVGTFWGWWGLPPRLHRDETVIGPSPDGAALPDVARFSATPQSVGSADVSARVEAVRGRARATFRRLTVELGDPSGEGEAAAVPTATARRTAGAVVLEVTGVTDVDDVVTLGSVELDGAPPSELTVDGDLPGTLRLAVTVADRADFWLHTLASPTRVVLDLRP